MKTSAMAVALVGAVGCTRGAHPTAAFDAATTAEDAGVPVDAIPASICNGRFGCRVEGTLNLGGDPAAHPGVERVMAVRMPTTGRGELTAPVLGHAVDEFEARTAGFVARDACVPWEVWLVGSGRDAAPPQLVLQDCSNDPGEGVPRLEQTGPDELRVTFTSPLRLEGWRQPETLTIDLQVSPAAMLHFDRRTDTTSERWDWITGRGEICDQYVGNPYGCTPALPRAHVTDADFAREGWKTTGLGECSLQLDARAAGWDAGDAASTRVRMLLSDDGTFYLEVTDDDFVLRSWAGDAFEVTPVFFAATGAEPIVDQTLRMDGTLWEGGRRMRAPVEMATQGNVRRFALKDTWPPDLHTWTIAYKDASSSNSRRRKLEFRAPEGGSRPVGVLDRRWPETCVPRDGELHIESHATPPVRGR